MSLSEVSKELKHNKKRKHLKKSPSSPAKIKKISWENVDFPEEEKIPLSFTPYPKKVIKKSRTSLIQSYNQDYLHDKKKSDTKQHKKRNNESIPGWTVTTEEVKPDKCNIQLNESALLTRKYLPKLLSNLNGSDLSDSYEESMEITSKSPDRLIPLNSNNLKVSTIFDSSFESDDSDSSDFNPPFINLKEELCEIIEPQISTHLHNDTSSSTSIASDNDGDSVNLEQDEVDETFDTSEITNNSIAVENNSIAAENNSIAMENNSIAAENNSIAAENNSITAENNSVEAKNVKKSIPKSVIKITDHVKYFIGKTHCIVMLKHPFKLYFNGKLLVTVLSGTVEILGHILQFTDETLESEVYCPRGQSFLCLETLESEPNSNVTQLLPKYLSDKHITNLSNALNNYDCIIALRNLKNKMSDYIKKHINSQLYPIHVPFKRRPLLELEYELHCLFEVETARIKLYKKHEEWPILAKTALTKQLEEKYSRTFICGGKNVGKSMLFRYMINNLLNDVGKVVCIDLDPGQSEFTIGGCVSVTIVDSPVFGPNYTHLRTPEKCFFIGVNVINHLDRYMNSIAELLKYCEQNFNKTLPWVINHMGFTKSIGKDITANVIKLLNPSLVIQIESKKLCKNYNSKLAPECIQNYQTSFLMNIPNNIKLNYSLHILTTTAEENDARQWICEPRLLREMCILSYFSELLEDKKEITGVAPYVVKIPSIHIHSVNYSKNNILATINGNLVALCDITPNSNQTIETHATLSCLGFGIVRGINKQFDELYLLTPIPEERLNYVNCLVHGNNTLPSSIYTAAEHQGLVPYISLGTRQGTQKIPKRSFKNFGSILKKTK